MASTPLKIETRAVADLVPYARNSRTHSDQQVAQIAGSIREFGFVNPVLIDPDGGIIAGHGRVLAARKLGLSELPVIVLDHLSENQKRAFMLADNRLALNAGWDEQMLRLELEELAQAGCNLEIAGFDPRELEQLLADLESQAPADPDEAPALCPDTVTQLGDLWALGDNHRLLCADSTQPAQLERVLEGASSNMIFTDLPFNVSYTGKTARRLTIVNDNLGDKFKAFLAAACEAAFGKCIRPTSAVCFGPPLSC